MPVKSDIAGMTKDKWATSFTVLQIKASFEGPVLWLVDIQGAVNILRGTEKIKARPDDRPPWPTFLWRFPRTK